MGNVIDLKGHITNKRQEYTAMINAAKALNNVLARWEVNISDNGKSTEPGFTLSLAWIMYFTNDKAKHEAMLDETAGEIMKACVFSGQPSLFYDYLDSVIAYIKSRANASSKA